MINHSGETNSLHTAYQDHLYRRQGLALAKELIKLIIDLQKHRGCTLAILSGDHFFETQLYSIQRDITEQLEQIEHCRHEYLGLDESTHILQEWVCIRRQWVNDTPEENFQLHSNLISELLKLIWRVVQRSGQLGMSSSYDRLITLCFKDWLKIIETTAQSRGLATHCAVLEHNPEAIQFRLKFLHRQLQELDEQFQAALDDSPEAQAAALTLYLQRVEYHDHLTRFLGALSEHFCEGKQPALDADTIYTYGSHAVSACQQLLFKTLKYLDKQLSPALRAWVEAGTYQSASSSTSSHSEPSRSPPEHSLPDHSLPDQPSSEPSASDLRSPAEKPKQSATNLTAAPRPSKKGDPKRASAYAWPPTTLAGLS